MPSQPGLVDYEDDSDEEEDEEEEEGEDDDNEESIPSAKRARLTIPSSS